MRSIHGAGLYAQLHDKTTNIYIYVAHVGHIWPGFNVAVHINQHHGCFASGMDIDRIQLISTNHVGPRCLTFRSPSNAASAVDHHSIWASFLIVDM